MRASNYTPVDAVKKLHEELDKLFAGKTFSGQGKNKPLNIFDFEFPPFTYTYLVLTPDVLSFFTVTDLDLVL